MDTEILTTIPSERFTSEMIDAVAGRILRELRRLPSGLDMDDLDCELYIEACAGIRSMADLELVVREMRRTCKFRPIVAEFREIIEKVVVPPNPPEDPRLTAHLMRCAERTVRGTDE